MMSLFTGFISHAEKSTNGLNVEESSLPEKFIDSSTSMLIYAETIHVVCCDLKWWDKQYTDYCANTTDCTVDYSKCCTFQIVMR